MGGFGGSFLNSFWCNAHRGRTNKEESFPMELELAAWSIESLVSRSFDCSGSEPLSSDESSPDSSFDDEEGETSSTIGSVDGSTFLDESKSFNFLDNALDSWYKNKKKIKNLCLWVFQNEIYEHKLTSVSSPDDSLEPLDSSPDKSESSSSLVSSSLWIAVRPVSGGVILLTLSELLDAVSCDSSSELEVLDESDPFVSSWAERFSISNLAFLAEVEEFDSCK